MKKLNKITVIGVGLIGGSFAKGLKEANLVEQIVGYGKTKSTLQQAVELGVVDSYSTDLAEAVANSDLVFIATPLGAMGKVMQDMQPHINENTVITDGGSAKREVIALAEQAFGNLPDNFVPGHPIAGKEKSGVAAADGKLYINHRVILTPLATTNQAAVTLVTELWQALGANVETMTAQQHDEIFAATSHLPHILAFALVDMLNEHPELGDVFKYTAGGFRDFTRIASSDATMWRDISTQNSMAIVKWLQAYQSELSNIIKLVENKDGDALFDIFASAKNARDTHIVK